MASSILRISQIIVSILLIVFILLQKRGATLGSAFGGAGATYFKRRGFENFLFWGTVILAVVFVCISVLNLVF